MAMVYRTPGDPHNPRNNCRPRHENLAESSGNSEGVSLFDRGGLLPSLVAIDNSEHFVAALSRITAHTVIGDLHDQRSVPHHAM